MYVARIPMPLMLLPILALFCISSRTIQAESSNQSTPKVKVMLLDGQMKHKGHKWDETTPAMLTALNKANRFDITVVTSPEAGQPNDDFLPKFSDYDVIIMNYEGDAWPQKTQEALVDHIKNGGGLVAVHAADNGFPEWPEWNEMIGIGGWGNRNEKSGPMVYWEDGKIKHDDSPGKGGYHGQNTDYLVTTRDPNHPIMKGLPTTWLHYQDELYSKMRGPGKNIHVLATGWQPKEQKGTERDELCLFTLRYGKGRIFHTTFGHDTRSVSCVGFIVTLQRGTEWAGTGEVTLTEVPEDFPTATTTSIRSLTP